MLLYKSNQTPVSPTGLRHLLHGHSYTEIHNILAENNIAFRPDNGRNLFQTVAPYRGRSALACMPVSRS